jgi:hypothetical protein
MASAGKALPEAGMVLGRDWSLAHRGAAWDSPSVGVVEVLTVPPGHVYLTTR